MYVRYIKAILTTSRKDVQAFPEIGSDKYLGKCMKLMVFSGKVTFSEIILFIAVKLVGGFFFTRNNIMCQI